MQVARHNDRQLAGPVSIDLSTASEASKTLKPVAELEADVGSQSADKVNLLCKLRGVSACFPAPHIWSCYRKQEILCILLFRTQPLTAYACPTDINRNSYHPNHYSQLGRMLPALRFRFLAKLLVPQAAPLQPLW